MLPRSIFSLSVLFVCMMCSVGRSAIVVRVDMDLLTPGVQSNVTRTAGSNVTAGLMFELTGSTSVSVYTFSVQFDTNELSFVSRSETPETLTGLTEFDAEPSRQIPLNGLLRRFDGTTLGNGPVAPFGPVKVGEISFTVSAPSGCAGDNDILPGIFELLPQQFDLFFDNASADITSQVTFFGGSVSVIPEPSSLWLATTCLCVVCSFRRRC